MSKYLSIMGIGEKGYLVAVRIEDTHNLVSSTEAPNLEEALVKAHQIASAYPTVLNDDFSFRPNPKDAGSEKEFRTALSGLGKLVNRSLLDIYSSIPN